MGSAEYVRFAPIPKCASRSLKELGLLGENPGAFHRPITTYPFWRHYHWHMVERDRASWYRCWWLEMKADVEHVAGCLERTVAECRPEGMQFTDMVADLALLSDPATLASLPGRLNVNAWLPDDCVERYASVLARGGDLYDYCIETITGGVECVRIPIADLDDYLTKLGLTPLHLNSEAEHARG